MNHISAPNVTYEQVCAATTVLGDINLKYFFCNDLHLSLDESNKITEICYDIYTTELFKELESDKTKKINPVTIYRPMYKISICINGNICIFIVLPTDSVITLLLERKEYDD